MPFAWYTCWQSVLSPRCVSFTCASNCFPELLSPKRRRAPSKADQLGLRGAIPHLLRYDVKVHDVPKLVRVVTFWSFWGGSLATKVHRGNWWGGQRQKPQLSVGVAYPHSVEHWCARPSACMSWNTTLPNVMKNFACFFLLFLSTLYYFWKRVKKSMSLRTCLSIHRWNEAHKRR